MRFNRAVIGFAVAVSAVGIAGNSLCAPQGFPGDPFQGAEGHCLSQVFMRLDLENEYRLHSGIDITANPGDPVYAHVNPDGVASVGGVFVNWIYLKVELAEGPQRSFGCGILHITPTNELDTGDPITNGTLLGWHDGTGHIHEEVLAREWGDLLAGDIVNPLVFAHKGVTTWTADASPPLVYYVTRPEEENGVYSWRVYVLDKRGWSCPPDDFKDGIYSVKLYVEGTLVDSIVFDRYLTRNARVYPPICSQYYCQCEDAGSVCHEVTYDAGPGGLLGEWEIEVCDYDASAQSPGHCVTKNSETLSCVDDCQPPTWGCLKGCYGEGTPAFGSGWPGPLGCPPDYGLCFPEGVFGKIGGFDIYWVNFDDDAWEYQLWESPGDEFSYEQIAVTAPEGWYELVPRFGVSDSLQYFYQVASFDSVMRETVARPGLGSIIGTGQCRLSGRALCAALDTASAVLFVAEAGGIIDVVDVSDPYAPVAVATHYLSDLGLWSNKLDDPYDIVFDEYLWIVCGNKGLAVLNFPGGWEVMSKVCGYVTPGRRVSLFKVSDGCCDGGLLAPPPSPITYAYYCTREWTLQVLELSEEPGVGMYLNDCGAYEPPYSETVKVTDSYALRCQDGCYLYVTCNVPRGQGEEYQGLHIVDISVPSDPVFLGFCPIPLNWGHVVAPYWNICARDGNRLFANWNDASLMYNSVIDISIPESPAVLSYWENALFQSPQELPMDAFGNIRIACTDNRLYALGQALVQYPEPSRYWPVALWGGLECYNIFPEGAYMFSTAVTDTGFAEAGDTSFVARTVTAGEGTIYVTYACAPDTDSVQDPPFNRLKVYVDTYEPVDVSAVPGLTIPQTGHAAVWAIYPNPLSPETRVELQLPDCENVSLAVYDVRGRQVRTLADGRYCAGRHRFMWDGCDAHGRQVSSGVYFVSLETAEVSSSRKIVIVR